MSTSRSVRSGKLEVPGASIYYEVRGSGPILLLIHGGGGDADKFRLIADHLADAYTVLTYDRRGHSRSNPADRTEAYRVEIHSEDAHRLLVKLTGKPAYVFGSSSGAVIGLDLCVRHPGQVRAMIPHEPVLLQLLSGNELEQAEQFMENLKQNHRSEVMKLLSNSETDAIKPAQSKAVLAERLLGNSTYFTEHEIPGILHYKLDLGALKTALKSASMRIVPAGGKASREFFPYRCAVVLAERLGTEMVEFPGNHGGYNTSDQEFALRLHDVIANCQAREQ